MQITRLALRRFLLCSVLPIATIALSAAAQSTNVKVAAPTDGGGASDWNLPAIPAGSPIASQLAAAESEIRAILEIPSGRHTFENTIWALDDAMARLDFSTGMTLFMQHVSTNAEERDAGELAEEHLNAWLIDVSKNEALYNAVREAAANKAKLLPEQERLVKFQLRDFRRAGMDLSEIRRAALTEIQKKMSTLRIEFDGNIRDDESAIFVTRDELLGMPDDWVKQLDRAGKLYVLSMDNPTFIPLLDLCDVELTRQRAWMAYKRRGGKDNIRVLEHILDLRAQAAKLLGYKHSADYEIEVRMAKNAETVKEFYRTLRPLVRQKAEQDWNEFVAAKREHTGDPDATLYPWDTSYYQNRLMQQKYAVDSEKVREYFPMQNVIDGLFSITQSLYGLEYREITDRAASLGKPLWHPDVRLFEVWDAAENKLLGEFYIDLHPRDNKYNHAAQWGLRQHKKWRDGTYEKPLAALVCNFTKPTADKPSLLSHDEVETFFHEFGHCLHTIVSEADYYQFAGTSVERDFVEAPSQMFENWVWDADVLRTFARHYQTGEPFPDELLSGMIAAKNLGSGLLAEHQFYYGLVDLACNTKEDGKVDTTTIATEFFPQVEMYAKIPGVYYHASFGHLTNYAAGYYGYQWSLVYACDMFQRFKELGMLSPSAGAYYREKILARGGTLDGLDLVRDYLQREPDMNAYLIHLGLDPQQN